MRFPARSALQLTSASLLIAGALLHAQQSSLSGKDGGALRATESEVGSASPATVPGASVGTRTPSSMTAQLQPVVEVLTNVLDQYRKSGRRDGEADTLCALGNSYSGAGQQQKAIEQFQLAVAIYRERHDSKGEANALSHIGDVYRAWGFRDMAIRFYREALQAFAPTDDKRGKAVLLNNLGVTYLAEGDKKKSLEYLNQALDAYRDMGDRHAEALTSINIGAAENYLAHAPEKALSLFQQAITQLAEFNDRGNEADAFEMMGLVWGSLHKIDTAESNFQRVLALYREAQNGKGEASVLKHLNDLHGREDIASIH